MASAGFSACGFDMNPTSENSARELTPDCRVQPVGRLVLRTIGDELLLVPISGEAARRNRVFPLNRTGAFLWERLSSGESLGAAAHALTQAFQVEADTALADCRAFCRALMAEGLLEAQV